MNKDYEGTPLNAALDFFAGFGGNQPGDPIKAVQAIIDMIHLQGAGQDKGGLLRLPLGTDCFPRMLQKVDNLKKELEQMRDIAMGTDVA